MQVANGLPDERAPRSTVHKGAGGTLYQSVHFEVDLKLDKVDRDSLYVDRRGTVHRGVPVPEGAGLIDPIDKGRVR